MNNKADVGIICALVAESTSIKNNLTEKETENILGIDYTYGKLSGKSVVIAVCGAGKVASAVCTQTMLISYSPSLIINTGVAGSISNELSVLDIVVANDVVQHDFDTSPCGDPVGYITAIDGIEMRCNEKYADLLSECSKKLGYRTVRARIATGDRFVEGDDDKSAISKLTGAVACDMEGGAIAQTCIMAGGTTVGENSEDGKKRGIGFCLVRAISDNGSGMEFGAFLAEAAKRSAAVVIKFISLM